MLRRTAVVSLLVPLLLPLTVSPVSASSTRNEVVHLLDADGDGAAAVVLRDVVARTTTTVLPEDAATTYREPELSPDGGRIALSTDRGSDAAPAIAVVGRDGGGFTRLTSPPSTSDTATVDIAPSWFPDGQRILFTRLVYDLDTEDLVGSDLHTVPADGSAPEAPLHGGHDAYAGDVDSTGTRIVFVLRNQGFRDDGEGQLAVLRLPFGDRFPLQTSGYDPTFHPTRDLIAYTLVFERDQDPDRRLHNAGIGTISAGGGNRRPLGATRPEFGTRSFAASPAWAPDGESIYYSRIPLSAEGEVQPADLWAVDARGGRAGRVTATEVDEAEPHLQGPAPRTVSPGAASGYVPVDPQRVVDTRSGTGTGGTPRKVGPGETLRLPLRGVQTSEGPVPADATAAVLNVTATQPDASTDVRVYPSGTGVPTVSNLNVARGGTVPNLVTAALGEDGAVVLRNNSGSVHLVADLAGFYRADGGLGYRAVNPARILDTREGLGAARGRVGAGRTVDLRVTGSLRTADGSTTEIPTTAQAVVLNVTGTGATRSTDVRVYPRRTGAAVPEVSNLNLRAGETAPNLVTVPVGEGGVVRLRNNSGEVHLLADVAGYYTASTNDVSRFVPVRPERFLDTREGVGAAPVPSLAGTVLDLQVAATRGVPSEATAVVLNLTATGVSRSTDVRAYREDFSAGTPTVSNLNLVRGQTRANLAVVRTSAEGRVLLRNNAGSVHLLADLAGYFVPLP